MIRMCILSSEPIIDERLAIPCQYRASILNRLDMHFPFIPDIICIELMFTEIFPSFLSFLSLSLFFSPFFLPFLSLSPSKNSLPRYIPAKFSAPTQSLTELQINFRIILSLLTAPRADECYYRYRAIIRILLRCL